MSFVEKIQATRDGLASPKIGLAALLLLLFTIAIAIWLFRNVSEWSFGYIHDHYKGLFTISIIYLLLCFQIRSWIVDQSRQTYVRSFAYPKGVFSKVIEKYPHLTQKDMHLVGQGLRQFFLAYLKSEKRYVSMPSKVADELWHEFILYTKDYQAFCKKAFGDFLHHTPAVVLSGERKSNEGLRRCWKFTCREERISPMNPLRLPLLFALDNKLDIADGYRYSSDCGSLRREYAGKTTSIHCGGDFSDKSIDGSLDGLKDSKGGDGCTGGGDGCGGGCGGGD